MLETVKSRSRTEDSELLFLKNYKCHTCGQISEFLQTAMAGPGTAIRCEHCGSTDLEEFTYNNKDDFYW